MTENDKPVAIVLGGTFPHGELLRNLKRRGYYTILVDYFDNPPAACEAHEHSNASAMDYEEVLNIARERNAQLVMSSCLDQQMVIAMRVSETLGLPHPFSSELALKVTNKQKMKRIMMENGIPTSRYYNVSEGDCFDALDLDYPVMVKAADNSGSAGVFKLASPENLGKTIELSRKWSRSGGVVVEEYKQGMEVSVYSYAGDGWTRIVTTAQRISVVDEHQTRCYSTVSPAQLSAVVKDKLNSICGQIAKAFSLKNTPLFFQVIVCGDDVSVIELSPRMGGGLSYRTMQLNTQFNMMDASISSYFGEEFAEEPQPEREHCLIHLLYSKDGVFDHLEGHEELLAEGVISEIHLMKTPGMKISNEKASSSRTAVLLIEGATEDECLTKLNEAITRLEVFDSDGLPLLDRTYWLTREELEMSRNASSKA